MDDYLAKRLRDAADLRVAVLNDPEDALSNLLREAAKQIDRCEIYSRIY